MLVNYIWNVVADQSDSVIFHVIFANLGGQGWIRLSSENFIKGAAPDNGQTVVLMKPHLLV